MTREWFEDNITCFDDLIEFCHENECDILDGLYPEHDFDSYVCEDIRNATRTCYWNEIRNSLNHVYDEHGGDYFFYNGEFDYVWVSEDYDFEEYKTRVIEWAEYEDFFEPDVEDDEFEDEPEEDSASADDGFDAVDINQLLSW